MKQIQQPTLTTLAAALEKLADRIRADVKRRAKSR